MSQADTIMRPGVPLHLSAILAVSGCGADYLNHYDSVTLAVGDANRANGLMQRSTRSTQIARTRT